MWDHFQKKYGHTQAYREIANISQKWQTYLRRNVLLPWLNKSPIDQEKLSNLMKEAQKQSLTPQTKVQIKSIIEKFDKVLYISQKRFTNFENLIYKKALSFYYSNPALIKNLGFLRSIQQTETYTQVARLLRNSGSPATVSIIAINVAIFGMWQIASPKRYDPYTRTFVNQSLISYEFLKSHFVTSWDYIIRGKIHSTILANFSHYDIKHFLFNMFTTYFAGQAFEALFSSRALWVTYLYCGIASMLIQSLFLRAEGHPFMPILGASGSMNGILIMLAIRQPTMKVLLYGIIPVQLWLIVGGVFLFEIFASRTARDNSAHEGHIAGMLSGALLYALKFRRYF